MNRAKYASRVNRANRASLASRAARRESAALPPEIASASSHDPSPQAAPVASEVPVDSVPRATPRPVVKPAIPELPPIGLALPPDSGLILVETSHPAPANIDMESEAPRPKRVRPPRVEAASEPLEIVETRKEP